MLVRYGSSLFLRTTLANDLNKINKRHTEQVKVKVWNRIGVDVIGPLNETPIGNRYIITCSDYFSKWPEAEALKTKDAEGVASFLYRLMARHCVTNIVMSDHEREFVADVNKKHSY